MYIILFVYPNIHSKLYVYIYCYYIIEYKSLYNIISIKRESVSIINLSKQYYLLTRQITYWYT